VVQSRGCFFIGNIGLFVVCFGVGVASENIEIESESEFINRKRWRFVYKCQIFIAQIPDRVMKHLIIGWKIV
jgi:hypothetical protein